MSHADDPIELLLAGYVTGTLDAAERKRFAKALREHPEWLARLADARGLAELSVDRRVDEAIRTLSPELLVDYVERRDALDASTIARIEARLESSELDRGAFDCLQRVDGTVPEPERSDPLHQRLWQWLRASLLSPAPALAYLLLLALLPALWWGLRDGGGSTLVPTRVEVAGERAIRDEGRDAVPALTLPAGARFVQLELMTELTERDLAGKRWVIEITDSTGNSIGRWPASTNPRSFEGKARFDLVLDIRSLRREVSYRISLAADAPGDPLDGQALFQRELRVE